MKKIIYSFVGALFFALSVNAQEITVKLIDNKWDGGENAQGFTEITPNKSILKGDKVSVSFEGTTAGSDTQLGVLIVETAEDDFGEAQWENLTGWSNQATVSGGKVSGSLSFTAANDVKKPVICFFLSGDDFATYVDVELNITVTCTAETPKAPEPGDILELDLNEISNIWDDCGTYEYDKETHTITECAWSAAGGWAFWTWSLTAGNTYLSASDFASFTIEFEPVDFQVQVVVQTDDGTDNGENHQSVADAGATSATLLFDDEEFVGGIVPDIRGMWVQLGEAGSLKITKAYFTYKGEETAISSVKSDVQVENGVVYSEGQISVFDVAGKKVTEATKSFNMNVLQPGAYFIQTQEGSIKYWKK